MITHEAAANSADRRGEVEPCHETRTGTGGEAKGIAVEWEEEGRNEEGESGHSSSEEENCEAEISKQAPVCPSVRHNAQGEQESKPCHTIR